MNPANSIAIVLDRVGNPDMAKAFAGVAKLLESTPESEVSDTYKALEKSMDMATQQTLAIINNSRVASLASNLAHWWKDLPDIWSHRKVRLNDIWAKVTAEAVNFLHEFDGSLEPVPQFISLREEQADEDYVARLHYLAGLDGNLRLLFMAADDPDIVYVADVMDEDAVSALLSPYPVSNWKSPGSADYVGIAEFTVHVVNGHRIFRTDGLIASCDLGALQVLQSGEFLPRMASLKTASVTRLTFTMNAMMDPCFRDFLRSMGGVPASVCSWDIPIHQEADIPKTLEAVKSQFGYSVMMYQVIDTPEQNIYASASPEGQVVRMLSAEIAGIRTGSVETADMGDVAEKVRAVTASVSGTERHALEKIAKACSVHSHYLVARTGEIKPSGNRFLCDITKLFANTRTEAAATKVYVFPGTPTQIVTAGVMDLDKNGDGTIDAIEMGTLGLMSDSDSASEPLDDSCPHGHCPKCAAEGDCVEGNDTICVDGHRSKTSAWKPCTCGPVVEAPEARVAGSNISNMTRQYAIKHDASFYVDTEDGLWHVFGDNTGFSYNHFTTKQDAENLAKEMNDSKTASTRVAAGPTNARDAFSKDKSFYVEIEDGVWHVFGDNTGFSYRQFYNEESADDYAEDMNKSKARVAYAEDHDLTKDETDFIAVCVAEAIKSGLTEVDAIEDFVLAKVEGDLSQEWAQEEENTSQLIIDGLNYINAEAKRQLHKAKTGATADQVNEMKSDLLKEFAAINGERCSGCGESHPGEVCPDRPDFDGFEDDYPGERTAKTASPLTQKERVAINASLAQAGFDGNKNFKSVSAALSSLMSILNSHGLELDEVTSADIYNKPTGHRSINVARSTEDPFSPESLQNTSVAFSWAPRGDSEFVESVAYLG